MRVCPHCQRKIGTVFDLHVSKCPLSPQHKEDYRAAMEDANAPGVLGKRVDYDKRRKPGMSSGDSLNHTFRLPWVEIGRLFDLQEQAIERGEDWEDWDAEIELGKWANVRPDPLGVPVLNNGRVVKHGEKTYVYYTVR